MAKRRKNQSTSSEESSRSRRKTKKSDRKTARRERSKSRSREAHKFAGASKATVSASTTPVVPKANQAAVPDWLSDLFPGGGASTPSSAPSHLSIPGSVSVVGQHKATASKPVVVPQHVVGLLTGNGEEALRTLRAASGAEINLRQDTQHLGYSIAVVSGTAQEVARAEEMIKQKLGISITGREGNNIIKEIDVQQEHLNAIVGPNGFTLAEVRQKAGGILIDFRLPQYPSMPVKLILGPGSSQHILTAEQLIRRKIASIDLEILAKRTRLGTFQQQGTSMQLPTTVCPHYAKGHCTNGSSCPFAHDREDEEIPPEKKLAAPCEFFLRGSCARGKGCLYTHSEEELKLAIKSLSAASERTAGGAALEKTAPLPAIKETAQEDNGCSGLL